MLNDWNLVANWTIDLNIIKFLARTTKAESRKQSKHESYGKLYSKPSTRQVKLETRSLTGNLCGFTGKCAWSMQNSVTFALKDSRLLARTGRRWILTAICFWTLIHFALRWHQVSAKSSKVQSRVKEFLLVAYRDKLVNRKNRVFTKAARLDWEKFQKLVPNGTAWLPTKGKQTTRGKGSPKTKAIGQCFQQSFSFFC